MYELPDAPVRLETTTASSYQTATLEGLFQRGHSKDHRPDMAQVKIMLASLDPLGLPLATEVVDGNRADDPLYGPTLEQIRATLNRSGILYVGDSKMAAESTRASVANHNDYYLMPLPATIVPTDKLDTYLQPFWDGTQPLTDVYRDSANGSRSKIAQGYEITEIQTVEIDGQIMTWEERRLIVRSFKHSQTQKVALRERLSKAEAAIAALTARRRGKKTFTTSEELQAATHQIVKRYRVDGLLDVQVTETLIERQIRSYLNRPARTETDIKFSVSVQLNQTAIDRTLDRLGWRVYATNAPAESFSLNEAVLAYREQYLVERSFGRLKGRSLSLTPMYLQRDDHATGLIRLLSIGLRVFTLLEFVVRRNLAGASICWPLCREFKA